VQTNKQTDRQTPLKTSTSLNYATPLGNMTHFLQLTGCSNVPRWFAPLSSLHVRHPASG